MGKPALETLYGPGEGYGEAISTSPRPMLQTPP
jgi:hypothetical protein